MTSRFLSRLVFILFLVTGAAVSPIGVSAASVEHVDGGFTVAIDPHSIAAQPVGGICRVNLRATFSFTGDLVGAFVAPFSILHAGACDQAATEAFQASGTYNGTVAGVSGSFDFLFTGTIDAQGHAQGELVILDGRGGLAGLHGAVMLAGQAGVGGTYTGTVTLP